MDMNDMRVGDISTDTLKKVLAEREEEAKEEVQYYNDDGEWIDSIFGLTNWHCSFVEVDFRTISFMEDQNYIYYAPKPSSLFCFFRRVKKKGV